MTRVSHVTLCLGLSLALTGCTRTIDMNAVSKSISDGVATQLDLPIASVNCPADSRAQKAGDTFECIATPQAGGTLTVAVTQEDDGGHVAWEVARIDGLLDLQKVVAAVQTGLKDQAKVDATVDCGGRWKGTTPGEVFECQATVGDQSATVAVTTVDTEGNITWKVL
jgi:hypothetical protein